MMASTPRKLKMAFKKSSVIEENKKMTTHDREKSIEDPVLAKKIEETNKKSNLLHEFLENLKKIANDGEKQWDCGYRQQIG